MSFDASSYIVNVFEFEKTARSLLSTHDTSRDRVISLSGVQEKISCLSVDQRELFSESISCIQFGLFRPAIVVAWAAIMDFIEACIVTYKIAELRAAYPKWKVVATAQELREIQNDYSILDAAAVVKILQKTEKKVLHGHLAKRNECAHPGSHKPSFNETLGYVDELLRRTATINIRLSSSNTFNP